MTLEYGVPIRVPWSGGLDSPFHRLAEALVDLRRQDLSREERDRAFHFFVAQWLSEHKLTVSDLAEQVQHCIEYGARAYARAHPKPPPDLLDFSGVELWRLAERLDLPADHFSLRSWLDPATGSTEFRFDIRIDAASRCAHMPETLHYYVPCLGADHLGVLSFGFRIDATLSSEELVYDVFEENG